MKKSRKTLLGALGLSVVTATTIYAATLPTPEAQAVSGVTDVITIRVVRDEAFVAIDSPLGETVTNPNYKLDLQYGNLTKVSLRAVKTDASGNIVFGPVEFWSQDVSTDDHAESVDVNFSDLDGFGSYIFTIVGIDEDGLSVESSLSVDYNNVDADIEIGDEGDITIIVTPPATEIEKVEIRIRNDSGELVSEGIVTNPEGQVTLPTDGLPAGDYTATLTYYDGNENVIGTETINFTISGEGESVIVKVPSDNFKPVEKIEIEVWKDGELVDTIEVPKTGGNIKIPVEKYGTGNYEIIVKYYDKDGNLIGIGSRFEIVVDKIPSAGAPDTGGPFQNLEISRADYLATGLLVFFVFAIVAFGVVLRGRKTTKSAKKRH